MMTAVPTSVRSLVAYARARCRISCSTSEARRPGKKHVVELKGFLATVFQHEFDHLDGKLYIDYLDSMDELIEVGASDEAEEGAEERAAALA